MPGDLKKRPDPKILKKIRDEYKDCDGYIWGSTLGKAQSFTTKGGQKAVGTILLNAATEAPNFLGLLKYVVIEAEKVMKVREASKKPEIIISSK